MNLTITDPANLGGTEGGHEAVSNHPPLTGFRPLSTTYTQATISHRALTALQNAFADYGHRPSADMWAALRDIARIIESMVKGDCDANYYLSSLDPGVGKTQTMIQTIKAIVSDPANQDVGVVVFLSHLDQIGEIVTDAKLDASKFATLTSDKKRGLKDVGLGQNRVEEAQVLFTTQRRLEQMTINGARFAECSSLHFKGRARQVRIWDESLCPARSITVDRDSIVQLLQPLRTSMPDLADDLETIFNDLRALPDRSFYDLPDFAAKHEVGSMEVCDLLPSDTDHRREVATSLWYLSGRRATVRQDRQKRLFIDYKDFLPDDLAPLLILDASGRVRTTYKFWEERRGRLVRLRTGHKRYDDLTVHIMKRSGSKGGWKKDALKLIAEIAAVINSKVSEDWLIVHHKPKSIGVDLPQKLRSLFQGNPDRLKFLTWGNHTATNAYKDVRNIVLAGTLFYASPSLEALGRAAAQHPSSEGAFSPDDCRVVEVGEHAHHILQALCRGAVRGCKDGVCSPADAYVIASKASGIPSALPGIFPGATVKEWKGHVARPLSGLDSKALEHIRGAIAANPEAPVKFADVADAIGIDRKNLKRIRAKESFRDALATDGLNDTLGIGFVKAA